MENIVSEETGEEILIERKASTGERVGLTIMHFTERIDAEKGLNLNAELTGIA